MRWFVHGATAIKMPRRTGFSGPIRRDGVQGEVREGAPTSYTNEEVWILGGRAFTASTGIRERRSASAARDVIFRDGR
jgi:hypothetical protein